MKTALLVNYLKFVVSRRRIHVCVGYYAVRLLESKLQRLRVVTEGEFAAKLSPHPTCSFRQTEFTALHGHSSFHEVCFAIRSVLFLLQAKASDMHKPQLVIVCSDVSR